MEWQQEEKERSSWWPIWITNLASDENKPARPSLPPCLTSVRFSSLFVLFFGQKFSNPVLLLQQLAANGHGVDCRSLFFGYAGELALVRLWVTPYRNLTFLLSFSWLQIKQVDDTDLFICFFSVLLFFFWLFDFFKPFFFNVAMQFTIGLVNFFSTFFFFWEFKLIFLLFLLVRKLPNRLFFQLHRKVRLTFKTTNRFST